MPSKPIQKTLIACGLVSACAFALAVYTDLTGGSSTRIEILVGVGVAVIVFPLFKRFAP